MEKRKYLTWRRQLAKTTDGGLADTLHARSHDQIQVLWLVTICGE